MEQIVTIVDVLVENTLRGDRCLTGEHLAGPRPELGSPTGACCKAFHQQAAAKTAKKEEFCMNDAVTRLRASTEEDDALSASNGSEAGRKWAMRTATARQLKRLARAKDPVYDWCFGQGVSSYTDAQRFFFLIGPDPDGDNDRDAADEFWESILGDTRETACDDSEFVHGFALGALEIWEKVANRL